MSRAFWGALYDESRRRRILARPDRKTLAKAVKTGGWNECVIRCEGRRIQLWLNVARTIADLAVVDRLRPEHLSEAIQYRSAGRHFWRWVR